jgi:hypothetical protein
LQNFIYKTHCRFGKYTKVLKNKGEFKGHQGLDLGFVSNTNMFILYKNNG